MILIVVCTAECISDTLAGGGGLTLGAKTAAVDYAKYGSHVKAAVMVSTSFLFLFLPLFIFSLLQSGSC